MEKDPYIIPMLIHKESKKPSPENKAGMQHDPSESCKQKASLCIRFEDQHHCHQHC